MNDLGFAEGEDERDEEEGEELHFVPVVVLEPDWESIEQNSRVEKEREERDDDPTHGEHGSGLLLSRREGVRHPGWIVPLYQGLAVERDGELKVQIHDSKTDNRQHEKPPVGRLAQVLKVGD